MKEHIHAAHGDQVHPDQVDDVSQKFGKPVASFHASDCPLCDYSDLLQQRGLSAQEIAHIPVDAFGRHLGRHLEQLALFVLPRTDLISYDDMSDEERETETHSDSEDGRSESGRPEALSEPEIMQKLSEVISSRGHDDPKMSRGSPDLAMRWQPPQDFTPPLRDFDADDPDKLPTRQEPIFGGDLHTSGWVRGTGSRKEGFCARCPVFHWVNIADGSYRFHLTYFHGVPDSGVPLPRPSTIRPVLGMPAVWEGFCNACNDWKILKKTTRGWNWYRHWLNVRTQLRLVILPPPPPFPALFYFLFSFFFFFLSLLEPLDGLNTPRTTPKLSSNRQRQSETAPTQRHCRPRQLRSSKPRGRLQQRFRAPKR